MDMPRGRYSFEDAANYMIQHGVREVNEAAEKIYWQYAKIYYMDKGDESMMRVMMLCSFEALEKKLKTEAYLARQKSFFDFIEATWPGITEIANSLYERNIRSEDQREFKEVVEIERQKYSEGSYREKALPSAIMRIITNRIENG